ncbi:MAG: ABC transporter ATP-binding protein [Hyphomicrobiales bacterium]|nr:ATP-binding cassette domain-containing protein [Hyphomicrobiales bacterium]PCH50752.1 MAG: ABC transporter ATP-binding protein [Hyphomicrobiales bacterium]
MIENSNGNALHLNNVQIVLNDKLLLSVNETVQAGEVLTLMGPSGSGKSSLLAYIAGFLDPVFVASGDINLNETNLNELPAELRKIGLLFQDAMLFPHMSVGQNLLFAVGANVRSKAERKTLVEEALEVANLSDYFNADPATLSGGQKSRIALMRVLLSSPQALLLDEPFSKLDTNLKAQIREFVFTEAKRRMLPILMVTHDEEDAKAAGGKVITL